MKTYKIILRTGPNTVEVREDTCQARNMDEARQIFEERHGTAYVVALLKVNN